MTVRVVVLGANPERLVEEILALPVRAGVEVEPELTSALAGEDALAVLTADLWVGPSALLRLLDDPSLTVGALLGTASLEHPVATQAGEVIAAGGVAVPDAGFLGGLYLAPSTLAPLRAALEATHGVSGDAGGIDGLLTLLVRTPGLPPVSIIALDPLPGMRVAHPPQQLHGEIAAAEQSRLAERSAARDGDGFYSTFVLRRVSARVTPWAIARGISANTVTLTSALVGLLAAASLGLGRYPFLVLGAVLLQASLVLDCVDGEVARATRTRTAFGGWLDSVTDRVKEYGALAGLTLAAAREGHELWIVAGAALAVQTARHVQDLTFAKGVLAGWLASLRDRRSPEDSSLWQRPPGSAPARIGPGTVATPGVWLRRILQMPIAERWLVLCVAALLDSPAAGVIAYLVQAVLAELWVGLGSARRTRGPLAHPGKELRRWLAWLRDDGLIAGYGSPGGVAAWALAPLVTVLEAAVICLATSRWAPHWDGAAFAWLAIVAWHRYDLGYRRGRRPPVVVNRLGLGWLVRSVAVLAAGLAGALPVTLVGGCCWLGLVFVPESMINGARLRRGDGAT